MAGILANAELKKRAEELAEKQGIPANLAGLLILANLDGSDAALAEAKVLANPKLPQDNKPLTAEEITARITELTGKMDDARKRGAWDQSSGYNRKITQLRNVLNAMEQG